MRGFAAKLGAKADADLVKAAHWYEKERPGLGPDFMTDFLAASNRIGENPHLYRIVDHGTGARKCKFSRFPYVVVFTIEEIGIVIHAIVHARRHARVWKNRLK